MKAGFYFTENHHSYITTVQVWPIDMTSVRMEENCGENYDEFDRVNGH